MANDRTLLTKAALDASFTYDSETGHLHSRKRRRRVGFLQHCGRDRPTHRAVGFKGGIYQEHIVVWIMQTGVYPDRDIDHRDTDPTNNRWNNLRLATNQQNHGNMRGKGSAAGLKGVHKNPSSRRHRSRIMVGGRSIHLGYFDTPDEAHAAYCVAAQKHFGEFARFR